MNVYTVELRVVFEAEDNDEAEDRLSAFRAQLRVQNGADSYVLAAREATEDEREGFYE